MLFQLCTGSTISKAQAGKFNQFPPPQLTCILVTTTMQHTAKNLAQEKI